jgi:hypothetical protein
MKKAVLYSVFYVGVLFGLANCGSSGGSSNTATANVCTTGSIQTSQGCLTTNSAVCTGSQLGWGYSSTTNTCYPPTTNTAGVCGAGQYYQAYGSNYGCNYYNNGYGGYNNGYGTVVTSMPVYTTMPTYPTNYGYGYGYGYGYNSYPYGYGYSYPYGYGYGGGVGVSAGIYIGL